MEVLLNDLSIAGQFSTVDDFIENLASDVLPILKKSRELGFAFLSKTTTYNLHVTECLTLYDLLANKHNSMSYPEVSYLKSTIANMIYDPYWDDKLVKTDISSSYELPHDCEIPNCITETFERAGILISLRHDDFLCKYISLRKNGIEENVRNSASVPIFHEHLIMLKYISFVDFLRVCLRDEKVTFCEKSRGEYYVDEYYRNGELRFDDMLTIKDDLVRMLSSAVNGKTSRFSKAIIYKKKKYFEFRTTISDDREFRIFYIQGDGDDVIFLYPLIKKTNQIPSDVFEMIEVLAKRYR